MLTQLPLLLLAYVVTTDTGQQVTYEARNARHARTIAEQEGHNVRSVFRE